VKALRAGRTPGQTQAPVGLWRRDMAELRLYFELSYSWKPQTEDEESEEELFQELIWNYIRDHEEFSDIQEYFQGKNGFANIDHHLDDPEYDIRELSKAFLTVHFELVARASIGLLELIQSRDDIVWIKHFKGGKDWTQRLKLESFDDSKLE
jgi:hypothetical protein